MLCHWLLQWILLSSFWFLFLLDFKPMRRNLSSVSVIKGVSERHLEIVLDNRFSLLLLFLLENSILDDCCLELLGIRVLLWSLIRFLNRWEMRINLMLSLIFWLDSAKVLVGMATHHQFIETNTQLSLPVLKNWLGTTKHEKLAISTLEWRLLLSRFGILKELSTLKIVLRIVIGLRRYLS